MPDFREIVIENDNFELNINIEYTEEPYYLKTIIYFSMTDQVIYILFPELNG